MKLVGIENKATMATVVNGRGDLPLSTMTVHQIQKFQKKIELDLLSGCWNWLGSLSKDGYAKIYHNGKDTYGHRISYEYWNGIIPKGLQVDHLCRNRKCVNPEHLEVVTIQENSLRGNSPWVINSKKTHCIRGHEYTKENILIRNNGRERYCRLCSRINSKKHRIKSRGGLSPQ